MPKVRSVRKNIMLLKVRSIRKLLFGLTLFILGFSVLTMANTDTVDDKIAKIQQASDAEKAHLIKQLKEDISEEKYENTDKNSSIENNTSIDANSSVKTDTNHTSADSKTLPVSKCSAGRCGIGKCGGISQKPKAGMSHAAKCGSTGDKCSGGKSHGSKCG